MTRAMSAVPIDKRVNRTSRMTGIEFRSHPNRRSVFDPIRTSPIVVQVSLEMCSLDTPMSCSTSVAFQPTSDATKHSLVEDRIQKFAFRMSEFRLP